MLIRACICGKGSMSGDNIIIITINNDSSYNDTNIIVIMLIQ